MAVKRLENSISSNRFTDGTVTLYPLTQLGEPDEENSSTMYFQERNLTYKRIMEAYQIQLSYTRSIAVQLTEKIKTYKCAEIRGNKYRIENAQEIYTSIPPIAVLNLSDWESDYRI